MAYFNFYTKTGVLSHLFHDLVTPVAHDIWEGSFVSSGWQILDDTATTNLCSTEGNTTVPVILGAEKTTIGKITGYPVINLYTNLPIFKYGGFLLQCLDLPDGTQTT